MSADPAVLPDYEAPPINEVVCGVLFDPLKDLLVPHIGLLWEQCFRSEYPGCQQVSPLIPIMERFGPVGTQRLAVTDLPLQRVWFTHDDGRIIQLQPDRFLHNWRKSAPANEYPHYDKVFQLFQSHLTTFLKFVEDHKLGSVVPKQYEMTYVNILPEGAGWQTFADIEAVVPDFRWRNDQRFLPSPDSIDWRTSFPMPDECGRLHMHLQSAELRTDKSRVFRFELTARGIGKEASFETMPAWFEVAHKWIVRGFADLTGTEIQRDVWRRKQ